MTDIINKLIPFLILPILTIYLSPSDYGIAATYGVFVTIVGVFYLSMNGSVMVNFFKFSREEIQIYISNIFIILFAITILIFFIVIIFQDQLSAKLQIAPFWLYLGIGVAISQAFTALNLGLWQVEQRPKPFGIYKIVQMLINTSLILLLVVGYKMGWQGQVIGQAIATIAFAIFSICFIYYRNYLSFKFNKEYIIDALKFGVPLIPHALSGWLRTGMDRILITMLIGVSATGLYSVGYQLGMIIGVLATAFNQAFSPYLYKKLIDIKEHEKHRLVKFTYLYFVVVLFIALVFSIIMPILIDVFLDERYVSSSQFIPWIAFGYAFQGMYFMVVNYIFYAKRTFVLAIITFSVSVLHVLISYIMININGAIGAAQATTISFFITFIAVWIWSAKVYSMPWTLK